MKGQQWATICDNGQRQPRGFFYSANIILSREMGFKRLPCDRTGTFIPSYPFISPRASPVLLVTFPWVFSSFFFLSRARPLAHHAEPTFQRCCSLPCSASFLDGSATRVVFLPLPCGHAPHTGFTACRETLSTFVAESLK